MCVEIYLIVVCRCPWLELCWSCRGSRAASWLEKPFWLVKRGQCERLNLLSIHKDSIRQTRKEGRVFTVPRWKKQQNELSVQHQLSSLPVFEPRMICWGMICCFFVPLLDKKVISEATDRLHQLSSPIQTPVQPHAKSHPPTHTHKQRA